MEPVIEVVRRVAQRRGFRVEEAEGVARLYPGEVPLYLEVRWSGDRVTVSLRYRGVEDFLEDVRESEEDPRGYVEELLDDLAAVAYELREELRRQGYVVTVNVRDAVMDVLELLEELEEM